MASLNTGVMSSNFLGPVIMHAAKFCTDCSLQMFLLEVFHHTVQHYSNLLKTKAFITVTSWLRSRTCLTRLICARLDMQDEVVFKTWSSKVSCESRTTPRPLTEDARARSFPSRDTLKSGSLACNCRLPKTMSFVLSGFKSKKLLKHQLRIKRRSLFRLFIAIEQSRILKEI